MELIKRLTLIIVCFSFISVFSSEAEEAYPPAVITAGKAVYQISMPGSAGTGFFIAPNLFVTNFHIVNTIQNIDEVSFYFDNKLSSIRAKKLLAISYPYDLALLETEGESSVYLSEGSQPQTTETIFTTGYPTVGKDNLKHHHSTSDIKNWNDLFYTVHFNFGKGEGSSGSPVLNSQGQFLGIVFGANDTEKSIIHSDWLKFTDENTRTICEHYDLRSCILKEVLRAKNLIQQFLAGQPVKRESLGIIHTTSDAREGVFSEDEEETYLLKMAKDFKDKWAQFILGILYRDQGDLKQAIYWMTLAAEGEIRMAQFGVGILHHGQGDLEKAFYWLTLAAENGVRIARVHLGALYHDQGDFEQAYYWWHLAADRIIILNS